MSLFKRIPESRTCEQVGIPPAFCMRGTWKELSVHDPLAKRAAETILDQMNSILHEYHHLCHNLTFNGTISAHEIIDKAGSNNSSGCLSRTVAVMLQVQPNDARFDARVVLSCDGSARVLTHPTRINQYGNTANCVKSEFIRLYCYCRRPDASTRSHDSLLQFWHLFSAAFLIFFICCLIRLYRFSGGLTVTSLCGTVGWLRGSLSPH